MRSWPCHAGSARRHLLSEAETEKSPEVHARLIEMEAILTNLDGIANKFLEDERKSKTLINLLKGLSPK